MKKIYSLFLLLIFIVFSCKGTPKDDKGAGDPGLSQLELTAEEDKAAADAGLDGEPRPDEDIAQDGITGDSKTDDSIAEEQEEEKPLVVEAIDEVKETPKPEEKKPPAPPAKPVPPPAAKAEERPPVAETPPPEQPAEEKQEVAQDESAAEQKLPERGQPWIAPPPAVTAVKDDAPVPNQRVLVTPKEEEIVFSRTVRATVGQLVEIPFRGTNWSYLEDINSRHGIVYNSRHNDAEGMVFVFRAEEAGVYVLRFYRRDFIRDYILYDYVQVIIDESPNKNTGAGWFNPPADRVRVTAEPRWPSALDEAAMLRGGTRPSSENKNGSSSAPVPPASASREPASAQAQGTTAPPSAPASASREPSPSLTQGTALPPAPQTVTPQAVAPPISAPEAQTAGTPAIEKQEKLPPEEMLKKAQDAFKGGDVAAAIALLDQYLEYYPEGGDDELYWLYGQFYEANTPSRNILLSLDYYRRLINEYPQSRRYNDARRRISYLERFYINIQ